MEAIKRKPTEVSERDLWYKPVSVDAKLLTLQPTVPVLCLVTMTEVEGQSWRERRVVREATGVLVWGPITLFVRAHMIGVLRGMLTSAG